MICDQCILFRTQISRLYDIWCIIIWIPKLNLLLLNRPVAPFTNKDQTTVAHIRFHSVWICLKKNLMWNVSFPYMIYEQWPFSLTWFNLTQTWISNYVHYTAWGAITNPSLIFNGATVEVLRWISNFISTFLYQACHYLSMLGLKLNHVSERGHCSYII